MKRAPVVFSAFFVCSVLLIVFFVRGTEPEIAEGKVLPTSIAYEVENTQGDKRFLEPSTDPNLVEQLLNTDDKSQAHLDGYLYHLNNQEDSNSQYRLSVMLIECLGHSPPGYTQERLDRLLSRLDPHTQAHTIGLIKEYTAICKGVYEYLGNIDVYEYSKSWLMSAAESGHPIAVLEVAVIPQTRVSYEEALPLVYNAIRYSNGSADSKANAYQSASLFYRVYVEGKREPNSVPSVKRTAFELAECKHISACDLDRLNGRITEDYPAFEYKKIYELAQRYETAVRNEDWATLGFE